MGGVWGGTRSRARGHVSCRRVTLDESEVREEWLSTFTSRSEDRGSGRRRRRGGVPGGVEVEKEKTQKLE